MATKATASGFLTPRLAIDQVGSLARLSCILRWVAIALAGLGGLLAPRVPPLLPALILAAVVYNGLVTWIAFRVSDGALPVVALTTTAIDQLFCFTFIGIYSIVPGGDQIAAYVPGLIEAVAYYGVVGAILSSAIFVTGVVAAQATALVLGRGPFEYPNAFAILLLILVATCLGAVHRVLVVRAPTPASAESAAVTRLTTQQRDVLQLMAEGCSNAMIAGHLGLSERRVKACVERLLTELKARNRAEAVAAAIRSGLL